MYPKLYALPSFQTLLRKESVPNFFERFLWSPEDLLLKVSFRQMCANSFSHPSQRCACCGGVKAAEAAKAAEEAARVEHLMKTPLTIHALRCGAIVVLAIWGANFISQIFHKKADELEQDEVCLLYKTILRQLVH